MTKSALFSRLLTASLTAVVGAMLAGGSLAQAQMKVATLNLEKALIETGEMKKEQVTMEARYKPTQDRIAKLQKELSDLQTQLQTMGDKLKPEVQQQMAADGTRKQRELQRLTDDLQADVDRDRQEILGRGRTRIETVVNKIAEEKGLDMIIDAQSLFFRKPALDITAEVTAAYDKQFPVAAGK